MTIKDLEKHDEELQFALKQAEYALLHERHYGQSDLGRLMRAKFHLEDLDTGAWEEKAGGDKLGYVRSIAENAMARVYAAGRWRQEGMKYGWLVTPTGAMLYRVYLTDELQIEQAEHLVITGYADDELRLAAALELRDLLNCEANIR